MVPGVVLEVGVQQLVSGGDHQRCAQLGGTPPGLVLDVPGHERTGARLPLLWIEQRGGTERLRPDDVGGRAVFVEEDLEWNPLILDEGLGVALPAGTYGNDVCSRGEDLFVTISDLTGPLAAGQSTEVSEKQHHHSAFGPAVAESVFVSVRVDQGVTGEACDIEAHDISCMTVRAKSSSPDVS